jgi:eukaryotic-like serine/threonine-protein kinase
MPDTPQSLHQKEPSIVVTDFDPLIGANLNGFIVKKVIAAGGMGLVYAAEHESVGRQVAVKVLKPEIANDTEWTKRFLVEARAIASLKHRNLIELVNFGKTADGRQYLMMEFLEGEALDAYMHRMGALIPSVALGFADQILNGLAEAHKKGVVHRDLKPSNIFLIREHNGEYLVKILDFGLARQEPVALMDIASALPKRDDGSSLLAGTPEYIAPEQAQGKTVDDKADLYSFGIVLYEMLAGQLPFQSNSVTALLQKHFYERPPPLSDVIGGLPEGVEAFVDSLLEKAPNERPTSADSARMTVQRLMKRLSTEATNVRILLPAKTQELGPESKAAQTSPEVNSAPSVFVDEGAAAGSSHGTDRDIRAALGSRRAPVVAGVLMAFLLAAGGIWFAISGKTAANVPIELSSPQTIEAKPVDVKPVDVKPIDVKSVDVKPVDVKPVDVKPVDVKPVDVKPVDVKPVDVKPVDVKPVDVKRLDAKPNEIKKTEVKKTDVAVDSKVAEVKASANPVDVVPIVIPKVEPATASCDPTPFWKQTLNKRLDAAVQQASEVLTGTEWEAYENREKALRAAVAKASTPETCQSANAEYLRMESLLRGKQ